MITDPCLTSFTNLKKKKKTKKTIQVTGDRIAEWLEAQPLAPRVWGSIPLFGQNVKSGKPF